METEHKSSAGKPWKPLGKTPAILLLVFLICALGITTAGWLFYGRVKRQVEQGAQHDLAVIADLKISQIVNWRRERLGDAEVISRNPMNSSRILPFLVKASPGDRGEDIRAWMESFRVGYHYKDVVLLDTQGKVRLSAGVTEPADMLDRSNVAAVVHSRKPVLSDFHRSETTGRVHLGLYAPLLRWKDAAAAPDCIGVMLLEIDPNVFLYPLIQSWPTLSPTAETLLARREGEEVVFLNESRHRKNTALALRFPLTDQKLPAAMAARGQEGIVDGVDYRGIRVLAALRRVPESPWVMVAKRDYDETIAPFRVRAFVILSFAGAAILVLGLAILFWGKRREAGFYRRQYELESERTHAEEALQNALVESEQHQAEVSALLEGSRAVLVHREFKDGARSIFDSCKNLTGATAGYVALLTEDGAEGKVLFLDPGERSCVADPTLPMPTRGLRAEASQTGKTVYHNDFPHSEWVKYMPAGHVSLDNALFAPLLIGGKTAGLLGLANKPGGFTENDARMVSAFGELAAIALLNSRMLEALQHSEERFRSVAQSAGDAIISADSRGKVIFWNSAAERMFGYTAEEALGAPLTLVMPERFRQAHQAGIRRVAETGTTRIAGTAAELMGRRKDGSEFPVELSVATWRAGGEVFFAGICRDITERKLAEENLRQVSDRLILATRAATVGIWDFDVPNNKLVWDDAMYRLYGITPDCFSGAYEAWEAGLHPDDLLRGREQIQMALRGEKEFDTEFRVVWSDKSVHHIKANGLVQRDASGRPVRMLGTNWDITARKELEAALHIAKGAAEAANRAKSTFLANMSHEIRTPMNAILGFSQLMIRDPALSPQQKQHLDTINRSGEHLLALINDVLEMSKIEAGRTTLNPTAFEVHGLLDDLESMFRVRTDAKQLQFSIERIGEVPRYVVGDESKLRQVLTNLLGNAVKFTATGGITLRARRVTDDRRPETGSVAGPPSPVEYLELAVTDTGPGIPAAEMGRLFQPFEQTSSGTRVSGGTGLGLAISREFVRLMGGEITVESRVGTGSVFRVAVRLEEAAQAVEKKADTRRIVGLQPGQSPVRVLIADDKEDNRVLLSQMLGAVGFETLEVTNGAEAIQAFDTRQPHLILMDLRMPGMDGYEAIRRIRARGDGKDVKIIAVTATAFEESRQEVLALGADEFLSKPFREAELFEKIRGLLGAEYVYVEEAVPAGPPGAAATEGKLTRDSLAGLPREMVSQMRGATVTADRDRLLALIAQAEAYDAAAAHALRDLADRFAYEQLLGLLHTEGDE